MFIINNKIKFVSIFNSPTFSLSAYKSAVSSYSSLNMKSIKLLFLFFLLFIIPNLSSQTLSASEDTSAHQNIKCFGDSPTSGQIRITLDQPTSPPYTYELFFDPGFLERTIQIGTSFVLFEFVPAGRFRVVITDNRGQSTTVSSITISTPTSALSINNLPSTLITSCNNVNDGLIDIEAVGGTPGN